MFRPMNLCTHLHISLILLSSWQADWEQYQQHKIMLEEERMNSDSTKILLAQTVILAETVSFGQNPVSAESPKEKKAEKPKPN